MGYLSFNQLAFELLALLGQRCASVKVWYVSQGRGSKTIQAVKAREGLNIHCFEEQLLPRGGDDDCAIHLHPNPIIELRIEVVHWRGKLLIGTSKLQLSEDHFRELEVWKTKALKVHRCGLDIILVDRHNEQN